MFKNSKRMCKQLLLLTKSTYISSFDTKFYIAHKKIDPIIS
jgi:hypothetical protein